ncbi:MAG: SPOR domain-containing protein [Marinosulfonomonas sp.]
MASAGARQLALVLMGVAFLSACEEGKEFKPFAKKDAGAQAEQSGAQAGATVIERDVEAPEVFQVTDKGLWDGRPSLGGVWVTHPDVAEPERVIIRNEANGKFVIAALYKPERNLDRPGPKFLVSSDAADALGMLAGAPSPLNVTALRHEEIPVETPEADAPTVDTLEQPEDIQETTITETVSDDPVAVMAASAIEEAAASSSSSETVAAAAPAPGPIESAPKANSRLEKPYIQIGIFSIESNADKTSKLLSGAGVLPTVKKSTTNGKDYWRVIVGPSLTSSERSAMLKKVKGLGFGDAYPVTH